MIESLVKVVSLIRDDKVSSVVVIAREKDGTLNIHTKGDLIELLGCLSRTMHKIEIAKDIADEEGES